MPKYGKHDVFIVHETDPFNGGTPAAHLIQQPITDTQRFYVRAHAPVPQVDVTQFQLHINGLVQQPLTFSLADLQAKFPKKTLLATLQCAGNRRLALSKVAPMPSESVMWDTEAISTALWGGVALADVLHAAGITDPHAAHVAFASLDECEKDGETFGYGGSIPLEKALQSEVLLAYEMNDAPLQPVHGYPLRVVVPGYIAARSVKWVHQITVQAQPSDNYYQQRDYKLFPPDVTSETVDWSTGEMLGKMRTDAVICQPQDGDIIADERLITVYGYAVPGDNAEITRVELSADGGDTWITATLLDESIAWTWRFWQATVDLSGHPLGACELIARVFDTQNSAQPQTAAEIWNFKGYMNNSWHRINVKLI